MKYLNALGKLSRFKTVGTKDALYFYSRKESNRIVKLINQDGMALLFPMFEYKDGEQQVVFSPKTIKSVIDFLEEK